MKDIFKKLYGNLFRKPIKGERSTHTDEGQKPKDRKREREREQEKE